MTIPVFSLEASVYPNLTDKCKIINKSISEYFLWIKLPACLVRDAELYQVGEVLQKSTPKCLDWQGFIVRDENHPWLRVAFGILNQSVGMHSYKLCFINKYTDDTFSLYFSYVMQDDEPDKPYLYMKDCGCCNVKTCY